MDAGSFARLAFDPYVTSQAPDELIGGRQSQTSKQSILGKPFISLPPMKRISVNVAHHILNTVIVTAAVRPTAVMAF